MNKKEQSFFKKATHAWGQELPLWVETLALRCDATSLRKTAIFLGVSPALISLAINKQRSKFKFIQEQVDKKFLSNKISCPILGEIEASNCLQEQLTPFNAANPVRVQLYRACKICPEYRS